MVTLYGAVLYVRSIGKSIDFYHAALGLTSLKREDRAALLGAPGEHWPTLFLLEAAPAAIRAIEGVGVHNLFWAASGPRELQRFEDALVARGLPHRAWTEQGAHVVEGRDPDDNPIVMVHGVTGEPLAHVPWRVYVRD